MTELLLTQHCYNDNVFELPQAKTKPKERNSNKQLAFRNLRSVFIMKNLFVKETV
jgi:hypothetical protein